jgi:CheY-like chemotaxis protein
MNESAAETRPGADSPPALARPRILCVDDEPRVLESLALYLKRRFDVQMAASGAAGLATLESSTNISVIISDMRMPGMDGVAFLRGARAAAPDATRILLTGQADMASAIGAINEGQIFRFLTKPCPPPMLVAAIDDAVQQHQLVTSERVLLQQTLHGSIKTLTEVLALSNPLAFGRATRIKQLVGDLGLRLGIIDRWQIEVAAMLSQLGAIALPAETVEKIYYGHPLDEAETAAAAHAPTLLKQWLGNIPRLEVVRGMLSYAFDPQPEFLALSNSQVAQVEQGAALLRLAADFDMLEARGCKGAFAVAALRRQAGRHHAQQLDALAAIRGEAASELEISEVSIFALQVGMRFAEDLKLASGALLIPRGQEVTPALLERLRMLRPGTIKASIRVAIPLRLLGAAALR